MVEDFFTPEELEPARAACGRLVDIVAQRLYKAGKIASESSSSFLSLAGAATRSFLSRQTRVHVYICSNVFDFFMFVATKNSSPLLTVLLR